MRQVSLLVGLCFLIVLAGCSTSTTYSAPPAEVTGSVASSYGYEMAEKKQFYVNKTVSIDNTTTNISIENWMTIYTKRVTVPPSGEGQNAEERAAVYSILSTPSINIGGRELNPLVTASSERIVKTLFEQQQSITIEGKVTTFNVVHSSVQEVSIEKYEVRMETSNNSTIDGYVLIASFQTEESFLIVAGVYPEAANEQDAMKDMISQTDAQSSETTRTEGK